MCGVFRLPVFEIGILDFKGARFPGTQELLAAKLNWISVLLMDISCAGCLFVVMH